MSINKWRIGMKGMSKQALIGVAGTSVSIALPSGAIGLYFGSDYLSSPKSIPNRLASAPPVNLIPLPNRRYNYSGAAVVNATTSGDGTTADPKGGTNATTITTATSQTWQVTTNPASVTLPAGTYTVGIWVRWRGTAGTSQSFWYGSSAAAGAGVATGTWQRFSKTFTASGSAATMFIIRNPNAATQMDFEVYGFSLYAGSVDLDASDPREAGHIMFGQGVGQNTVATGTGTVRFNGATHGVMQLPSSAPLGNVFSVVYIAKTFGSPSASSFNSLWGGSIGNASSTTALGLRTLTNQFGLEYSGAMVTPVQPTGEIYEPGNTFGGVAVSYDGSTGKLYSNGLLTGSLAVTKASFVLKDIFVGCMNNSGTIWYSNYELAAMAIFPRVLTDAEQLQAYKYLKSQLSSQGVTIPDTRVLIYEGDSITYGSGAANTQGYPYLAASQMTRGERGPNYGVFGSKFADMNARLPTVTAMIDRAVADGRTPIVHFDIGSNDFVLGVSASTLYNQVKGYAATCRAHGAKVIAGTVLSRPEAGVDAIRNAYNPMLAAGVGVDFDGVTNFGTTAMGVDGAWSNTTNFAGDQVHPTSAGYAIMAPVAAAAVNALP